MRRRLLTLLPLLAPTALMAQLPNTSTRALGLGAYTVIARGYEAAAWNPALLGMRGNPGLTIGLPQASMEFGSSAFGLSDFQKYSGKFLSAADKAYLLGKIDTTLGIRDNISVSPFGLSIGHFALSIGVAGDVQGQLGKDAVDLALNGNASNPARLFSAAGSGGSGWAATTAALSVGWPLHILPIGRLSVGGSFKKIWGMGLGYGIADTSSRFQVQGPNGFNVQSSGQAIYTDYSGANKINGLSNVPGSGYGVDVGGVLQLPAGLTVGLSLVNVIGSMTWNASHLRYERGTYTVTQSATGGGVNDTHTDSILTGAQINGDPRAKAFRDSVLTHSGFARLARAGASLHVGKLLVAADAQVRLSDGIDHPPAQLVSGGAEYVLFGILPLRAGLGTDFANQFTFSGGTGLYLGPVHLDLGAADITGSKNPGVRVGAGLSLIF